MSTMNADTYLTSRRVAGARRSLPSTGFLPRALVVLATLIAGTDR